MILSILEIIFKLLVFFVTLPFILLLRLIYPLKNLTPEDQEAVHLIRVIESEKITAETRQGARTALKRLYSEKKITNEMAKVIESRHNYLT